MTDETQEGNGQATIVPGFPESAQEEGKPIITRPFSPLSIFWFVAP